MTRILLLLFEKRGMSPINKFTYLNCVLYSSLDIEDLYELAPLFLKYVNTFLEPELSYLLWEMQGK